MGVFLQTNLHSCPNILPYCMPCNENPKHTDGKYFVINYFLILNMGAANCFGAPMSWTLAPDVGFIGCFVLIIGDRPPPAAVSPPPLTRDTAHRSPVSHETGECVIVCNEQEYCTQEHPQWNMIPVMLCWLVPPVPAVTCVPPHSSRQWSSLAVFLGHHATAWCMDNMEYGWISRRYITIHYRWCWHYIIVTNASKTFRLD